MDEGNPVISLLLQDFRSKAHAKAEEADLQVLSFRSQSVQSHHVWRRSTMHMHRKLSSQRLHCFKNTRSQFVS